MVLLAKLSSPAVDALPRDIVVLYPVASCEQHSLHLPVFVDTMISDYVCSGVSDRCGDDVLVLPCQHLGYSHHHARFPGTLTSTTETFMTMMEETIESLAAHGFTKFLIVNSHGGNNPPIAVLLQRLMQSRGDELEIYHRFAWATDLDQEGMRTLGPAGSGHAGETETSMMLHLHPDLVDLDQLDPDGGVGAEGATATTPGGAVHGAGNRLRVDQMTMHGGVGDPRPSTAAAGKVMLDASIEDVVKTVMDLRRTDPFPEMERRRTQVKHRGLWRPKL